MRAILYHRYGSPDVLQLEDTEKPTAGDHDLLGEGALTVWLLVFGVDVPRWEEKANAA